MSNHAATVFERLLWKNGDHPPLGGVPFSELRGTPIRDALRLFASRLVGADSNADEAALRGNAGAAFLLDGVERIQREMAEASGELAAAAATLSRQPAEWDEATRRATWSLFFPEGAALEANRTVETNRLREHRRVTIESVAPDPISDPITEMVFTSNVLITVPAGENALDAVSPEELRERIRATMGETQLYYYDHPIHIGVPPANNEAIYGLRGLDEAVAFEKDRADLPSDARATVILSLSVTHEGLHRSAREYLHGELVRSGPFDNLQVYLFTELECRQIVKNVLQPFLGADAVAGILDVFGVDGEYGRHYTFLKAIAAIWSVFVDRDVKGTFKIDLDQVFPQAELVAETGKSAFEHFRRPLWGARALDDQGTPVDLGMIAGALVNEKDIHRGLFTPDVPFPDEIPAGEATVFYNKLPMALSTEAEMMTRYDTDPNGRDTALQRYHVTGGTNGILVRHLRAHRPFTPGFIGRAEDQAFLLSVLYRGDPPYLRYLHAPGLIMRHDKEAFAGESIRAAQAGRFVGDLARTFYFTTYARALPWGVDRTKTQIDPFTGCFVSRRPATIIYLRLALHLAELAANNGTEKEAVDLLNIAERKLAPLFSAGENWLQDRYNAETLAWNHFYDALERAEGTDRTAEYARAAKAAGDIVSGCRIG